MSCGCEKRPRILLVETDAALRRALQLTLRGHGFDVRAFSDARHIVRDPAVSDAVCLVADLQAKGMDESTLLGWIRARSCSMSVILIRQGSNPVVASAPADAFCAVIEKPLLELQVVEAVKQAIALRCCDGGSPLLSELDLRKRTSRGRHQA